MCVYCFDCFDWVVCVVIDCIGMLGGDLCDCMCGFVELM